FELSRRLHLSHKHHQFPSFTRHEFILIYIEKTCRQTTRHSKTSTLTSAVKPGNVVLQALAWPGSPQAARRGPFPTASCRAHNGPGRRKDMKSRCLRGRGES